MDNGRPPSESRHSIERRSRMYILGQGHEETNNLACYGII